MWLSVVAVVAGRHGLSSGGAVVLAVESFSGQGDGGPVKTSGQSSLNGHCPSLLLLPMESHSSK